MNDCFKNPYVYSAIGVATSLNRLVKLNDLKAPQTIIEREQKILSKKLVNFQRELKIHLEK